MSKIVVRGMKCPVARTLSIIGDKWTILILRDLLVDGPKKYQDLLGSLEGISPNLLSHRLKKLIEHEIIQKDFYSSHPPRYLYSLTKKGETLKSLLKDLRDWGLLHTHP